MMEHGQDTMAQKKQFGLGRIINFSRRYSAYSYISLYLTAIVAANLLIAKFGPSMAVINSFLFIGFDLVARDKLHDAWQRRRLLPKMAALIAAGSLLSWLFNRNSGQIGLASFAAFALAGGADALLYHRLRPWAKLLQVNGSNVGGALIDSIAFPLLAGFPPPLLPIIVSMFVAKVAGGAVWSVLLSWKQAGREEEVG